MTFISSSLRRLKKIPSLVRRSAQPAIGHYLEGNISFPAVEIGDAVGNEWDEYRVAIGEEFRQHPMAFLRQPVISRTVHPNQQGLAEKYLLEMAKNEFARENILPRLHDVPIGNPFLCESFPLASPMSAQHAWYLLLMHTHLDLFVPNANLHHVLELGGGYGNFCRLACSFGYDGRYVIADLPEMHCIQRHFLKHSLARRVTENPIQFRSLNDPEILPEHGPSLFMATFSLSETPLSLRFDVEPLYDRFDYLFIAYNRAFGSVDNLAYFDGLRDRLSKHFELKLVQDAYRPAWFLMGRRSPKNCGYCPEKSA